ncbi:hypothetical protein [Aureibaculum conchae]|uniref:hypothetical protein n=1 Tax=Aureibaculum sp. 2308TA14-22 TaxID=3108392 RepID=UPI00339B7914
MVDAHYGIKQGEFVVFVDGKDKRVQFKTPKITKSLPEVKEISNDDLDANFLKIHDEVKSIFE